MKVERIIKAVAARHRLQPVDLLTPGRFGHIVAARREVMLELKARGWSSSRIGEALHLDHTTVLHHINPKFRAKKLNRYPAKKRQRYGDEVRA